MSVTDISGLQNSISTPPATPDFDSGISGIPDPIGKKLVSSLNKTNSLQVNVSAKIDDLINDINDSSDSKSQVSLVGNKIVITANPEDKQKAEQLNQTISNNLISIQSSINKYSQSVNSLNSLSQSVNLIKKAADIQDALMMGNPITKVPFEIFKKAIKVVFLKDMMSQYANIITGELIKNKQQLSDLIHRFDGLQVQLKIKDENSLGNTVNEEEAGKIISSELLSFVPGVIQTSEDYLSFNGKSYILKVLPYGDRKLIGYAYEKISGQVAAETAPSITSASDELMSELKSILG